MSNQHTGEIRHISEIETIKYGPNRDKEFQKRTLVLEDAQDEYNDCFAFELGGKKLNIVDGYKPGDVVSVSYNIKCRENKNKPGQFFTSLGAWKVERVAGSSESAPEPDPRNDEIPF